MELDEGSVTEPLMVADGRLAPVWLSAMRSMSLMCRYLAG